MSKCEGRFSALKAAGKVVAAAGAAYAGYVGYTWLTYGRGQKKGSEPLLEQFLPEYEVVLHNTTRVMAPAAVTYRAAKDTSMADSPMSELLMRLREMPSRMAGTPPPPKPDARGLVAEALASGWGILHEVPDKEIVVGVIAVPSIKNPGFSPVEPSAFRGFDKPGFGKIAWTLSVEPVGLDECILRSETRVATTDEVARNWFRTYWAIVSPGVHLIHREVMRLCKANAERRAAAIHEHDEQHAGIV
jgi:hypothetical protein